MADPKIRLKRSSVEGKIPTPDQVPLGEIALNTYDGYLYASKNVGIGTTVIAINPFRVGTGTDTYNAYFTAGNVGIGTETPTTKLDVDGTVNATAFAGYDYLQAPHGGTVNYSVTVVSKTAAHRYNGTGSGNGYAINGVESPFLTLTPGRTYRFTLSSSDMSSHPFRFYLEADKTTAYTTNVTSTATYTEIVVTDTTPPVLHYQCSAHGYMGNAVQVNSSKVNTPYNIEGLAGANISGVVTATSFSGSGSNLTGLTGASAATYGSVGATPVIVVDSDGRITGISTVATEGGINGISTTGTSFFNQLSVSGVSTFHTAVTFGNNVSLGDFDRIRFGDDLDLQIYHDSVFNYSMIKESGDGPLMIASSEVRITNVNETENLAKFTTDGAVELYYDGSKKFETTSTGVSVAGVVTAVSGVVTYYGDGSNLTNLTGASAATYGNASATPVITVDSNGRITGISTVATSGGGGSVSEAFKTIAVSGQSDVVADSATDTLTFVAGSNMTITTNASGDSITFASSGGGGGSSSVRTVNRYVATQNQTLFPPSGTVSYTVGYLDVYLNGSRLDTTEFTASNGTTVTLTTGASANDIVELIAFTNVGITSVTVVDDSTPQLGGDLDLNGNNITGTGNINITGTATVTGGQVATQNDAIAFAIALG